MKDISTVSLFYVKVINVIQLSNERRRLRRRIENEGSSVQENENYALEHIYIHNPIYAKACYHWLL